MNPIPEGCIAYKRTAVFTETTVPAGLLNRHSTKAGVWGKIVVEQGRLRYLVFEPEVSDMVLTPGEPGVAEPMQPHEVMPLGAVRFYIEFYRMATGERLGEG